MTVRILVVCTANVCRSPVVERLLERRLADAGVNAIVRSAGTHGGRLGVHEHTVRAACELGLDLSGHRSRELSARLVDDDGTDLVVVMTREHLRSVVGMSPAAWSRTFTLKELVRRAEGTGAGTDGLAGLLVAAGAGRTTGQLMVPSTDDDLDDPYGGPYRGHQRMVAEVDDLVARLARRLARVV